MSLPIQFKKGLKANLPASANLAEPLYTTDEKKLYIGNGAGQPLTLIGSEPVSGGSTIGTSDQDFAGYKAIAMACDNGTSFPSNPSNAQWFYRSDLLVLFMYTNSAWQAMCSFGALNIYVDGASGTDAVGKGWANGTDATATVQYAVNMLPKVIGGNIIINIAAGTYREAVTINNIIPIGNYTVTIQGALSQIGSGTVTSANYRSLTVTGANWSVDQFKHKLLKITGGTGSGQEFIILGNTNDTINVQAISTIPTAGSTFEIYNWQTRITGSNSGTDTTASKQYGLLINNSHEINLNYLLMNYYTTSAVRGVYGALHIVLKGCYIHDASNASYGGVAATYNSYLALTSTLVTSCVNGATAFASSVLNCQSSVLKGNTKSGIMMWGASTLAFFDNSLLDSNATAGIYVKSGSSMDFASVASVTISNNGTGVILENGFITNKLDANTVGVFSGNTNGNIVSTLNAGTEPSALLKIDSTSNVTKGVVSIAPSGGNIGIGTLSPIATIDTTAYFPDSASTNLISSFTSYNCPPRIALRRANGTIASPTLTTNGTSLGSINFRGHDGTNFSVDGRANIVGYAAENYTSTSQGSYLTFSTTPIGSITNVERVRITDSGNVGIGTTPTEKLDVIGNIKAGGADQSVFIGVQNNSSTAARYPSIVVKNYDGSGFGGFPAVTTFAARGNSTTPLPLMNGDRVCTIAGYGYCTTGNKIASSLQFDARSTFTDADQLVDFSILLGNVASSGTPTERLRIKGSTGNVGIGTTNPTEKLDVNGNLKITGNYISAANTEMQFLLASPQHKAMHFNKGYGLAFTENSYFLFNNIGSIDAYSPNYNGMQLWGHPVAWNIANSTWKGIWNSATSYVANDTVILGTTAYQCISPNTNQTPPNATYWAVITLNQFPYLNIYSRSTSPVNGTDYEYVIGAQNTLADNSYLAQSIRFKSATSSGQTNENQGQIAFDTGIANALVIGRSGDVTTKGALIINSPDWINGIGTVSTNPAGSSTLIANTTGSFAAIKDGSSIKLSNGTIAEVLKVIDSSTIALNQAVSITNLTWSYKLPATILQSNGSDYGYIKSDASIGLKGDGIFNPKIHLHGYGGNPAIIGFRANGTSSSASGVAANDTLMSIGGGGYGSSGFWSTAVNMQFKAGEAWVSGATGTYVVFNAAATGTSAATEKLRIDGSGILVSGNATTKAVIETYVTLTASGNTFTPNLSLGSTFGLTLGATNNIGTPTNIPASGLVASITLLIRQDNTGNRTISSYPASFSWGDSGQPALTTTPNKMDVITCFTVDGGTTWTCFLSGRGFN